ncbi:MAG: GGDEF domain-containing protein [Proteobacteria bacterium]|nr:GGDEF domain-containing protein [Pseudomonadota bacterium]
MLPPSEPDIPFSLDDLAGDLASLADLEITIDVPLAPQDHQVVALEDDDDGVGLSGRAQSEGALPNRPILLLHQSHDEADAIAGILRSSGFEVQVAIGDVSLEELLMNPPLLMLVSHALQGANIDAVTGGLKAGLSRVPVVYLVPRKLEHDLRWDNARIDDYVRLPLDPNDLVRRLRLCLSRLERTLDANPLTGLPGNTSILNETQRRIASGRPFAFAYLDVDNFKAFNDLYGYQRGDDALKMTCRILCGAVEDYAARGGFVGHVGGDDFVFIGTPEQIDRVAEAVIRRFDMVVSNFYDEEDAERGAIISVDRRGNTQVFPFMTVSIAIVSNEHRSISHSGQISKSASELKKKLKTMEGSNAYKDRRRD